MSIEFFPVKKIPETLFDFRPGKAGSPLNSNLLHEFVYNINWESYK